MIFLVLGLTI